MRPTLGLLLALFLFAAPAHGITVSRITEFEAGTPIVADDLNAEFDNIIDALDGNLNVENFVSLAIATQNIATASVTTDKINNGAVTRNKLDSVGQSISSSSGTLDFASEVEAAITNLSATVTTHGRPVWVGLQSAGGLSAPGRITYRSNGVAATGSAAFVSFRRAGATVNQAFVGARDITAPTNDTNISLPCSSFWFLDTPASGSQAYTAHARTATADGGFLTVENCKLVIFEL